MDELRKKVAGIIRNRRQDMDMTQEELAGIIEKSPSFVGQLERGESSLKLGTLCNVIKALGIDANTIFTDDLPADEQTNELLNLIKYMDEPKRNLLLQFARMIYKMQL